MTWLRRQFRTFARCYHWWQLRLTLTGKLLTLAVLLGLPGMTSLDSPLFPFSCGLVVLLLTAELTTRWMSPELDVRFVAPRMVERHVLLDAYLILHNRSRQRAFEFHVVLEPAACWKPQESRFLVENLAPGEQLQLAVQLLPERRGVFSPPTVVIESTFPLNITRVARRKHPAGEITVTPTCQPLPDFAAAGAAGHLLTDRLQMRLSRGHEADYIGSRDYVPGLPVRRWDYGSWARLGQPIVREFSEPRDGHVQLIVDTSTPGPSLSSSTELDHSFEALLSAAASISLELTTRRQSISTLVLGSQCHSMPAVQAEQSHLEVLRRLARATPSVTSLDVSQLQQFPETASECDLVVLVSLQHEEHSDQLRRALLQTGIDVIAVDVTASSTTADGKAPFTVAVHELAFVGVSNE